VGIERSAGGHFFLTRLTAAVDELGLRTTTITASQHGGFAAAREGRVERPRWAALTRTGVFSPAIVRPSPGYAEFIPLFPSRAHLPSQKDVNKTTLYTTEQYK